MCSRTKTRFKRDAGLSWSVKIVANIMHDTILNFTGEGVLSERYL